MSELKYLLDTNILSDLVRHPKGRIFGCLREVGEDRICTSIVVAAELRFGAHKKGSMKLINQVDLILSAIQVIPLDQPGDEKYANIRAELERCGTPIGPNDMLIAAHALALDLILVTANFDEFSRVSGLSVENWMK